MINYTLKDLNPEEILRFAKLICYSPIKMGDIVRVTSGGGNDSQFPGYPFVSKPGGNVNHKIATGGEVLFVVDVYLNTHDSLSFKLKKSLDIEEYYVVRQDYIELIETDSLTHFVEQINQELNE